jgi:hypothetical protein
MRKLLRVTVPAMLGLMLLVIGSSTVVTAGAFAIVPEIDATTGISALALLAGATLVIRGRRQK